ncbi:MAG: four helix bundle protein [Bacteroidales bacterium]|nr:four helix bundle protein [Bacteroidales bacterium]
MGTIKNFEDLEIWKLARGIVNLIYSDFRSCKDYTYKNQISGAGISVMNNTPKVFAGEVMLNSASFLISQRDLWER